MVHVNSAKSKKEKAALLQGFIETGKKNWEHVNGPYDKKFVGSIIQELMHRIL